MMTMADSETERKELIANRLAETFNHEVQELTASRLNTSQSNVSKWVAGQQIPTSDYLWLISTKYNVSVDWLLGLSNKKTVDEIDCESLTYGQVIKILERLLKYRILLIPNLYDIFEILKEEDIPQDDHEEVAIEKKERTVSDYMQCNDRLLSYLLRKREVGLKLYDQDEEAYEEWAKENHYRIFNDTRIVDNRGNYNEALDILSWATTNPTPGDWKQKVEELSAMSEEERQELINNHKEGKQNG